MAIDCPGYGRSPGDKQLIRSEPGALVAAVVAALGRSSALAVIGSSQVYVEYFTFMLHIVYANTYIQLRAQGIGGRRGAALAYA